MLTNRQQNRQTDRKVYKQIERYTNRQKGIQTDRKEEKKTPPFIECVTTQSCKLFTILDPGNIHVQEHPQIMLRKICIVFQGGIITSFADPVPFLPDPDPIQICLSIFQQTKLLFHVLTGLKPLVTLTIKDKKNNFAKNVFQQILYNDKNIFTGCVCGLRIRIRNRFFTGSE